MVDGIRIPVDLRESDLTPMGYGRYLVASKDSNFDTTSMDAYSKQILAWWRQHGIEFPAWAKAARIMFAFTPSSASSERVFALLKNFLGDQQMSALADGISVGLMLAHNERAFG